MNIPSGLLKLHSNVRTVLFLLDQHENGFFTDSLAKGSPLVLPNYLRLLFVSVLLVSRCFVIYITRLLAPDSVENSGSQQNPNILVMEIVLLEETADSDFP